jgi:hypothetical protein
MTWKLADEDGWSLTLTDEAGEIIGFLKARTDEQKANARKVVVAPEALALLERIVAEEDRRPDWYETARQIIARSK